MAKQQLQAVGQDAVLKAALEAVAYIINDKYARFSVNKFPEVYTIRLEELQDAYREAYTYMYNESVEEARWPEPDKFYEHGQVMHAGFKAAGKAAFDWINNQLDSGKWKSVTRVENHRNPIMMQMQKGVIVPFFSKMKTEGLRELAKYIKDANGKEMKFYADLNVTKGDLSKAEDVQLRRLIHRLHLGQTTTGYATLSGRMKALDRIAPGFTEALTSYTDKDITALIENITHAFDIKSTQKGLIDIERNDKKFSMELAINSYKANLEGARPDDLKTISPIFQRFAYEALQKVFGNSAFLTKMTQKTDIVAVRQAIANKFTRLLVLHDTPSITKITNAVKYNKKTGEITLKQKRTAKLGGKNRMSTTPVKRFKGEAVKEKDIQNLLSIRTILNLLIGRYVQKNMGLPGLVYRTGRFANTVQVTSIKRNPSKATLSAEFAYMDRPYSIFQPGSGSDLASEDRDPRELIKESIRDIMRKEIVAKFKEPSDISKMTFRRGGTVMEFTKREWKGDIGPGGPVGDVR